MPYGFNTSIVVTVTLGGYLAPGSAGRFNPVIVTPSLGGNIGTFVTNQGVHVTVTLPQWTNSSGTPTSTPRQNIPAPVPPAAVVNDLSVEARAALLGYRPALPLFVWTNSVTQVSDIAAAKVPNGGYFIMDAIYLPQSGDGLFPSGAMPGYIGMRTAGSPDTYVFRAPEQAEVVCLMKAGTSAPAAYVEPTLSTIDSNTLAQWQAIWNSQANTFDNRTNMGLLRWNGVVWLPYRSYPQRSLDQQMAFAVLDPAGAFNAWAQLIGALMYQISRDNYGMLDLLDPDDCPTNILPLLAAQFGYFLPSNITESQMRQRLRVAVSQNQAGGNPASIAEALSLLGYSGYAKEIWINPTSGNNWHAFSSAPGSVQTAITNAGFENDINTASGQKGQDWIEVTHCDATQTLTTYWPSGRLSIHVNQANGSALTGLSAAQLFLLKQKITQELAALLPANVSIRFFATDTGGGSFTYF